jgi:aerobic-type carbon monoxide dehydrogenase small subunit (CoxS/CutS family)
LSKGGQCSYCTCGIIMTAKELRNGTTLDRSRFGGIAGNLCRCTGYTKIVKAIRKAAESR